jgi:hypothetical protein
MGCPRQEYNLLEIQQLVNAGLDDAKTKYQQYLTNPTCITTAIDEYEDYQYVILHFIPLLTMVSWNLIAERSSEKPTEVPNTPSDIDHAWAIRIRDLSVLYMDWQEAAHLVHDLIDGGLSHNQKDAYRQLRLDPKLRTTYLRLVKTIGHLGCQQNSRLQNLFMCGPGMDLYTREDVSRLSRGILGLPDALDSQKKVSSCTGINALTVS